VALRQLEDLGPGGSGEISVLLRGGEEAQVATRVKANVSVGADGKVSVTLGGGVGVHVGVKGQQGLSLYAREMVDVAGTYKFPSKEAAASFLASFVESPPLAVVRAGVPAVVEGSLSGEAGVGAQLSDVFSMGGSGALKVGFKADLEKGTLTLEGEAESKVNGGIKTPFSGGKFSAPLADAGLKATCRLTLKLTEQDKAIFADGKVTEQELTDLIKRQEKTAKREVEVKMTATLGRAVEGEAKLVIPVSSFPKSPDAVAALCVDGAAKWAINTYRLDNSPSAGIDVGFAGFELKTKFRHLMTHHEGIKPDQVAEELSRCAPPQLPPQYLHRAAR
jgi:hypothetical protein